MPRLKTGQSSLKQKCAKPAINQTIKTRPACVAKRAFIGVPVYDYLTTTYQYQ
ncbi:hypothetical protein [Bartonella apis]|uniref:hypothetical protein n=1 Tax=Bartonella apis TaxID=1686310 RepID=UPI003BB7D563